MNDLIVDYDVSAIDYMWGFFGKRETKRYLGGQLIVLNNDGRVYRGLRRTKQYYVIGQFSKFIRPGARRVKAETVRGDIHVSAFRKGTKLTLVGINAGSSPRRVRFAFEPGSPPPPTRFRAIRTGDRENWRELGEIPLSGNDLEATLPPRSVTTFIGNAQTHRSPLKP